MKVWQTVVTDAAADLVKIVTTWAIAALSIQGVTWESLWTQRAGIALALAVLAYLANWAASFRKSGDPIPPPARVVVVNNTEETVPDVPQPPPIPRRRSTMAVGIPGHSGRSEAGPAGGY